MKNSNALKLVAASAGTLCSSAVFAHAGHDMNGPHWHAADTWGFMLALSAVVWLLMGRPDKRK